MGARSFDVLRPAAAPQEVDPAARVGEIVFGRGDQLLGGLELLAGHRGRFEQGLQSRYVGPGVAEPILDSGHGRMGQRQLLGGRTGREFLELGARLAQRLLRLPQLGDQRMVGEPGDHVARLHLVTFVHGDVLDDP